MLWTIFLYPTGLVVFGAGHIVCVWRIYSHPACPRSNRAGDPTDSGTQGRLTRAGLYHRRRDCGTVPTADG